MRKSDPRKLKEEISNAAQAEREFALLEGMLDRWDEATLARLAQATDDEDRMQAQAMHLISKHFRKAYAEWQRTGRLATDELNREERRTPRH